MLVLTRRIGEQIVIAGNIRVQILAVHDHRVKVGIMAPEEVPVFREEVQRRRQEFLSPTVEEGAASPPQGTG